MSIVLKPQWLRRNTGSEELLIDALSRAVPTARTKTKDAFGILLRCQAALQVRNKAFEDRMAIVAKTALCHGTRGDLLVGTYSSLARLDLLRGAFADWLELVAGHARGPEIGAILRALAVARAQGRGWAWAAPFPDLLASVFDYLQTIASAEVGERLEYKAGDVDIALMRLWVLGKGSPSLATLQDVQQALRTIDDWHPFGYSVGQNKELTAQQGVVQVLAQRALRGIRVHRIAGKRHVEVIGMSEEVKIGRLTVDIVLQPEAFVAPDPEHIELGFDQRH
mmetsp:Transcript_44009/g.100588  ORF Transcript_44009/g.100588 Transcript_44009/m.100588 type:complete len:280 (+) Transcript_44009:3-842(+)